MRNGRWRFVVFAIFVLCLSAGRAGADPATSEDASWTGYVTSGIQAGWEKVTGLFRDDEPRGVDSGFVLASLDASLPDCLAEGWGSLTNSLTEALRLRDEREKLPDSAWFGEDKSSNARKINKLLDAALEVLTQGRAGDVRREASNLRASIADLRHEADRLRNDRITAPVDSKVPWRTTQARIDERLKEIDGEIRAREASLAGVNGRLADALREMGLELDQGQVDVLLSSVTGDDMLQNTVVFSNVKAVVEQLASLAGNDQNDLEINRRYTGLYLVLNDLLIHTQEELVRRIDEEYGPRLKSIVKEALALEDEARKKAGQEAYNEAQRASFRRNAEANAMTVRVGKLYADLLAAQRRSILENLKDLRRSRDVAENTYRTVRSSGDLKNLIHSGLALFDSIDALSMPQLQPFESEAMRLEFEEINRRLKER